MSNLTANGVNGLMEAYAAVYDQDLREELEEEEVLVEQVGIDMIENAAYVLFSQGYDVDDVISYFTEATTNTIIEDYLNFSEGNLIIESVVVSDEYIQENFELLENRIKAAVDLGKAAVKTLVGKGPGYSPVKLQGPRAPGLIDKGKALLSKAATKVKDVAKGAKALAGKAPAALKGAVKLGGKALPFAGSALYGADAVSRAKKGDWGGAALSGLGAATSFAGPVAALAPAAIQMGTDALGLTGDRSRKGSAKPTPAGPPSLKGKQDFAKSKGKYYSSSDQKTYKNYNDALAAKNSRRGVKPTPATAAPSSPTLKPGAGGNVLAAPAPRSTPSVKVAPTKPAGSDTKLSNMQKWAKANPTLASKVKLGQSGYDDISATRTKPGPNEKQDQTPTQGPSDATIDPKAVDTALKAQQERDKKKAQPQTVSSSYEYDAYDLVLEYLLSQGHADTLEEANYVMLELDAEMIGDIVEVMEGSGMVTGTAKVINTVLKPVNQTPEQKNKAVRNLTKGLDVVVKPIKNFLRVSPEQNQQMMNKRRI